MPRADESTTNHTQNRPMKTTQTPEAQNLINAAAKASEVFTPDELEAALPPRSLGPLVSLTCCCCGTSTKGRQWWNRDTGYGLCDSCIAFNGVAGVPMGGTAQSFGVRGVHWGIDTRPAIMRATQCFAHASQFDSLIDMVNPDTGRSCVYGHTLEQMRERYPDAEIMDYEAWSNGKVAIQDAPVTWEEITEARYWELLECLPPACQTGNGFLVGEPSDHHAGNGRPLFQACIRRGGNHLASSRPMTISEFRAL